MDKQLNRNLSILVMGVLIVTCMTGVRCTVNTSSTNASSPTPQELTTVVSSVAELQPTPVPTTTTLPVQPTPSATFNAAFFPDNLLQSNGDCQLPCWWGIVPGETDWASAEAFLAPYSLQIAPYEREEYMYYTAYLVVPEQISERPVTNDFAVWGNTVQLVSAAGQTGASFTPVTILQEYGAPDQIWLQTANSPREGILTFATSLVYLKQGFLLIYGSSGNVEGTDITTCISNTNAPLGLLTWGPKLDLSYVDAMAIGANTSVVTDDIDLETATGLSVQEFYDNFSVEGSEVCLRTPRSLWPNP
jgi:hypothetical protein